MDRRLIQTAVFGNSNSDEPAVCPETVEELEDFRRAHENDTIWCGTKFEGGCGRRLTTRLYTDKICHFAHYASSGTGERCGRKAKDKDSANHLFAKAHLAAWLNTQGLSAEFSYPEPLGSTVLVHLEDGRTLLLHLDRNRPVRWDEDSWEVVLGPGVPIEPDILEQRGYVLRIRFEDRPGGGRNMRLGTEHPGAGTTWDGLEDVKLTSQGLNTSTRPDAVRAPMPEPRERGDLEIRSLVGVAPSRPRAASTARQDDPVKRVLMHLDRALRDQPDHLYSTVRAIQRLLEKEQSPESVGRLRLALDRGRAELEKRRQYRKSVLARLREQPTPLLLTEVTQLMRDLDVTAEERETVRAARVRLHEEQETVRREQAKLHALREARLKQEQLVRTEHQREEQRERNNAARRAWMEQTLAEQREQQEAAERRAQQERAEKLDSLAPFVLGALKKAAREKRATTWREIQDKTGQREVGRLTHQEKLAILETVEKKTLPESPLWSTVLAATGSADALHLHRDLLQRLRRPALDEDARFLAQIHGQCAQLSRQW
ncbi:hypothetical protein AB0E82_32300 [Streptomyces anulatus]|uniref:hypothetical protein n=1 Tax=Streptomyces anulatus TaxID=1892 RepID=UPI0033DDF46F